ncbi:MAG: cupin domain-containing protein [Desulfococcaceae bacterium]
MKNEKEASRNNEEAEEPEMEAVLLKEDGDFPNNSELPLLLFPAAADLSDDDPARVFEERFSENGWGSSWRNGIFPYHHYHSTAHEVLGVYRGEAKVLFGGEDGEIRKVATGDVVVIPAGVAHKCLEWSSDLGVVGAYPGNQRPNLMQGKAGERPEADKNIAAVPLPESDPLYGPEGPLMDHWKAGKE